MYDEEQDELLVNCNGIEIYENDIERAIADACRKLQIDDLVKEGQQRWKAVCHYVGKRVFPDRKMFRNNGLVNIDGNIIPSNCNRYDTDILNILCDYYILLSRRYNKIISTVAFSEFVNIPRDTIDTWGWEGNRNKLNNSGSKIHKKLHNEREDALKDKCLDNGNVMGTFQVGRREYNWDVPGVSNRHEAPALSAADLPVLGIKTVQHAQIEANND